MTKPSSSTSPLRPESPSPMVGRGVELDQLRAELRAVVAGEASSAVLVVGACGVGKSRLVSELVSQAEQSDVRVLRGQCVGRGAEPLLPVREALSSCLGSTPDRIKQVIKSVAPQLAELVPFVGRFLAPVVEAVAAGPQLGGAGVQGVYAGLEQVFHGLAEKSGMCLVIEDLHAADQDTLFFLTYLMGKTAGTRTLAVFSLDEDELEDAALREVVDDWTVQGWTRIDVHALTKEAVAEYAAAVSGTPPSSVVVDMLYDLTAGNVLLLKELLPLVLAGTASDAEIDLGTLTLPKRVQAVMNRRLLHIDKELRTFLEAAAVCLDGAREFAVIPAVLKLSDDAGLELLDSCSRSALLVEVTDGQVRFVHEAMRLAVYADVPEPSRRRLHQKAAEWFESSGQAASAAHHFARAGRTADVARTALLAASLAERVGMYRSAVTFYEQARPYADERTVGPPLAKALIMLGRWGEAEELLNGLPHDDAAVQLLWSDLHFVRGRIHTAAKDVEQILPAAGDRLLDCLTRLADVYLYLGEFATAGTYAKDALTNAERDGSVDDRARCLGIVGATVFFGGDVDEAERLFNEAYALLDAVPERERDRTRYTVILGNLGQMAEARADWAKAESLHSRALTIRREVFDARGLLQSLHAVARSRIGAGAIESAAQPLAEAESLAITLAEPLESAKLALTRAKLNLAAGAPASAVALGEDALRGFIECGTSFDAAHAQLALAQMYAASGDERRALSAAATAHVTVDRKSFGLLRRQFPDHAFSYAERILAGLHSYAYGDAFGLPWEGSLPSKVDAAATLTLPARDGWARGATSDDTALTLLVSEVLAKPEPGPGFLRLLAERAPTIPGLGPSTTAAIQHYQETGEPPTSGGLTNGAAMRALPIGWLLPPDHADRRRALTIELSRATHAAPEAQCAACVMSACATWAVEGASRPLLMAIAREEAAIAAALCGADVRIVALLAAVDAGEWSAGLDGVSLDPYDTVAAVLTCVRTAGTLADALLAATLLGGDTDTVAALVGGLLGCQLTVDQAQAGLSWSAAVLLPDPQQLAGLADQLALARVQGDDG